MVTDAPPLARAQPIARRWFGRGLIAIVALALALRLAAALGYDLPLRTDAYDYDRTAVSIVAGHGYPQASVFSGGPSASAFRPPGYPLFLAGVYSLSGTSSESTRQHAGQVAQAVLGTAVVALTALIAYQLWGPLVALIAGAIAAVYPPLIYAGTALLSEPLFTVLVLCGVASLLHYRLRDQRLRWLVLAGLCGGLATLTRENGALVVLLLALSAWTLRPRLAWRSALRPALVVAVAVLTVAPWTIRNAITLHAFVPVSTEAGFGLAGQYNDIAAGDRATWLPAFDVPRYCPLFFRVARCPLPGQRYLRPRALGEVEVGSRLTHRSREFALDHPTHVFAAGFWNGLRFFDLENPIAGERRNAYYSGEPQGLAEVSVYAFWALALVALAGCFTALARRMPAFMWLIPVLLMLSVVFVGANSRYRAPAEPIFVLLAACATAAAWERLTPRRATAS